MKNNEKRILLIRTGGTMDSLAYADPRNPPKFVETLKGDASLIKPTIGQMSLNQDVDMFTWGLREDEFVKDSQKFVEQDIKALADIIKTDDHKYFIITHGTDAMAKNAKLLQKELEGSDKIVVFAGAMVPLSMHNNIFNGEQYKSDGRDALKFAIENIRDKKDGVYITGFNEHTKRQEFFSPETVEKNKIQSKADLKFTLSYR
jgi:L-asparaginase/Glu-tRNA(Gln) amidotransferase subunit D